MQEKIGVLENVLKKARYRRALESGDSEVFVRGVKRALGEDKGKEKQEA